MLKKRILVAGAAGLLAAAALFLFLFKGKEGNLDRLRGDRDHNVLLITVDTLRADRIGCYGFNRVETPTIDLFASRGIQFDRCISQTPLTFPSHTTLFTGTYPLYHGIRDNGGFYVPPELQTMAELFKAQGYETAAFVAAYVLDSKWGLDQGFDHYFDQFDLSRFENVSLGSVQRPGNEVMDEALKWLEDKKDGKFFVWIHLYDPHTPYEPPAPFDAQYANHPYLGEIAFTDTQLARLWDFCEANGLLQDLFLIFASDHGESLGEHKEGTHGFFVYQEAVHVPLIIVTPFEELHGVRTPAVVSLVDVLPTLCEMSGLKTPSEVQGRSLVPLFFNPNRSGRRIAYAETFYPRFHYGWSELQSIQDGRFKLIVAPIPELYDLVEDPEEQKNLVYLEKEAFERLSAEAETFFEAAGRNAYQMDVQKIDEETREKLAALGYIGSFMDQSQLQGKRLGDPKEKIGIFNELSTAREMGMGDDPEQAVAIIRKIIADDPEVGAAHFTLGNIFFRMRNFPEAIDSFIRSLELKPDDTGAVINVANSYVGMGKFEEAENFVTAHMSKGFSDSQLYFLLGNLNYLQKQYDQAIPFFEECLSRNPESAASHNILGAIHIVLGNFDQAESQLQAAAALMPHLANLNYNLAQLREKQGRGEDAAAAYLREIEYSPRHFKAMYNLSRLYRLQGQMDEEFTWLQKAIEANPDFPLSYFYLARIHLNRGEKYREAVDLVMKGLELGPEKADLPLGYFLLADLYNRLGDDARSREYALKGQAAAAAAPRR